MFDPPVALPEGAEVQVEVIKSSGQVAAGGDSSAALLEQVETLQERVISRGGPLVDSAPDIAADRLR